MSAYIRLWKVCWTGRIHWKTDFSGLGDLEGASYEEVQKRVRELAQRNPSQAIAAVLALTGKGGPFTYTFHPEDLSKYSPQRFWNGKKGVCAEYHIFMADVLSAAGLEAHPVEVFEPGLAHVVMVYRDPKTGLWDVADYSQRYSTQSSTPEAAVAAVLPGYYQMVFLDTKGGQSTNRRVLLSPQARTMRDFMRRTR